MNISLTRRAIGEGLSTAFLLAIVIGSGIMGERLAGGNVGYGAEVTICIASNVIALGVVLTGARGTQKVW